jgi:hypothetical protein
MASPGMLRRVALVRTDARVRRLLVTANVVPSSPILVTLMTDALSSSETSVLTRAAQRNILEDTILRSHRRENLRSYNIELEVLTVVTMKSAILRKITSCKLLEFDQRYESKFRLHFHGLNIRLVKKPAYKQTVSEPLWLSFGEIHGLYSRPQ